MNATCAHCDGFPVVVTTTGIRHCPACTMTVRH